MTSSKALTPDQAYQRLADRCSMAELCTGEALALLRRWGVTGQTAFNIVQRLVNERFIDDERFARIWVRSCLYDSRWGVLKIRAAARQKQLDDDIFRTALNEVMDPVRYAENLGAALRSKARNMPSPLSYDCRARLARFAASRGYEMDLIMGMLDAEDVWRADE